MKQNMDAVKAVLKALQKNCYDDMADEESKPEDKMAEAVEDVGNDEDELDDDALTAKESVGEGQDEEQDEDPVRAALKDFMRTKKGPPPRPGTAVMISVDKPMVKKKSIKDLMNG